MAKRRTLTKSAVFLSSTLPKQIAIVKIISDSARVTSCTCVHIQKIIHNFMFLCVSSRRCCVFIWEILFPCILEEILFDHTSY